MSVPTGGEGGTRTPAPAPAPAPSSFFPTGVFPLAGGLLKAITWHTLSPHLLVVTAEVLFLDLERQSS